MANASTPDLATWVSLSYFFAFNLFYWGQLAIKSPHVWHNHRDDLISIFTINPKIAIQSQNSTI